MMLPIMVGLQMAVSVTELEQGELAFQASSGNTLRDWEAQLALKMASSLAAAGEGAEIERGFVVRSYGPGGAEEPQVFCLVPKDSAEKCPQEY